MRVALDSELDLLIALEATKRRVRVIGLATVLGTWFAAAGTWLLLFVIVDHAMASGIPRPPQRTTNVLFWLGSFAWLGLAGVLPLTRRINDLYVARLIEKTHPEFRNALVDAIQITRHEELPGSVRAAVMERAARDATCVEPTRSVPTHRLRRTARAAVAVVVIFLLYGMMSPKSVWPSLLRGLGFDLRAPSYTRIVGLTPANGTSVLTGRPVAFAAKLSGRRPPAAFVRFSFDEGQIWSDGQQLPLAPPVPDEPDPQWRAIKAGQDIRQSMLWQVVAGDVSSEIRRIEVRPIPAVTDVSVQYVYPPATHLPPTTRPGGDIDAPRGTQVTIRAATNVPAFNPLLILGRPPEERSRVLEVSAEGTRELRIPLTVTADDEYRIEFRDGHGEANVDPVRYTIRARAEERALASAPLPASEETVEEVASEPAPAESRPAELKIVGRGKTKRGSSAPSPASAPSTEPSEGEWVTSTSPADSQPSTQIAMEEGNDGLEQREATTEEKEFTEKHQRELEALAKHLLNRTASQPDESAFPASQPTQADSSDSNSTMADDPTNSGQPGEQNQGGEGQGPPGDGSSAGSGEGTSANGKGQGSDGQAGSQGQGESEGETGSAEGQGSGGQSGSPSQGKTESDGSSSDSQGSSGQGAKQGEGTGQGSSQGEGESAAGKPNEKTNEQPSGSGGSAGGGSGGGLSPPTTNPGDGAGAQQSESLAQDQGSSRRVATVGQAKRAIDALDRDLRRGEVDRSLLDELGWDVKTAERFVEAYKRSGMRRQPSADVTTTNPGPRDVRPQSPTSRRPERIMRAAGPAATEARGLIDSDTRPADNTHDLMEVGHQRVPPRYKPILDAYYRTLASQPSP